MSSAASSSSPSLVNPNTATLLAALKHVAPPLSVKGHKGQQGRVGVIGGSKAYTGAPYFAAQSCLSLGADLVTVFCSVEAAGAIKAYSPDLMVRPTLFPIYKAKEAVAEMDIDCDAEGAAAKSKEGQERMERLIVDRLVEEIESWSAKLDVQVIGPGLGKDELISKTVGAWIVKQSHKDVDDDDDDDSSGGGSGKKDAKKQSTPLVIDGDGIHVFQHYTDGRAKDKTAFNAHVVLTPNAAEFRRLYEQFVAKDSKDKLPDFDVDADTQWLKDNPEGGEISIDHPLAHDTAVLAKALGGMTIVRKGFVDVISNGARAVVVSTSSPSPRRVGGQGDVLAGATGMFLTWVRLQRQQQQKQKDKEKPEKELELLPSSMLAAWSAAHFCRALGSRAYSRHGRSMLASHLLLHLPEVLHEWFPLDGVKITPKL